MGTTRDTTVMLVDYSNASSILYNYAIPIKSCAKNMIIINTSTNLDFRGTYSVNRSLTFFPPMVFGVSVKRTASFPKHSLISSRKRSTKNDIKRLKKASNLCIGTHSS